MVAEWESRFWSKIDKSGECWLWTAGTRHGYGMFSIGPKKHYAHRFAYELIKGPIPRGLLLDHQCRVRACANPSHLRPVTRKQNGENRDPVRTKAISGVTGVYPHRRTGKWVIQVKHNYKIHHDGPFSSIDEAAEAVRRLRLSLFTHNDIDKRQP